MVEADFVGSDGVETVSKLGKIIEVKGCLMNMETDMKLANF